MKKLFAMISIVGVCVMVWLIIREWSARSVVHSPSDIHVTHDGLRVVVVRHGQSDHNVVHRFNSNPLSKQYTPSHLTEVGRVQVTTTAHELLDAGITGSAVTAVYVSPLPRAQETAEILVQGLKISHDRVHTEPRITEVQMGEKEGSKTYLVWNRANAHAYGGETEEDVFDRVKLFIDDLLKQYTNGTVLIVTHATPASQVLRALGHESRVLGKAEAEIVQIGVM